MSEAMSVTISGAGRADAVAVPAVGAVPAVTPVAGGARVTVAGRNSGKSDGVSLPLTCDRQHIFMVKTASNTL